MVAQIQSELQAVLGSGYYMQMVIIRVCQTLGVCACT